MLDEVRAVGGTARFTVQGIESTQLGEPFDAWPAQPGPCPKVSQGVIGLAGDNPFELGPGQAIDAVKAQPDPQLAGIRPVRDPFHPVFGLAAVDVQGQDGDAQPAGFGHQQPFGVHAGIVFPQPGQESLGVVRLEPGGLVGGDGKCRTVRLAEAEAAKGFQGPPDLVHHLRGVPLDPGLLAEELFHRQLEDLVAERPAELIRPRQAAAGHHVEGFQDLFMEDSDSMRFLQHGFQVRVRVDLRREAVPVLQEGPHHVRFHRARPEQRNVDDEVIKLTRRQLADQFPLSGRLDLETAQGVGAADQFVGWFIIQRHGVEVDMAVLGDIVRPGSVRPCRVCPCRHHFGLGGMDPDDFPDGKRHGALHPDPQDIKLEHAHGIHVMFIELAHGQPQSAGLYRGPVKQRGIAQDHPAGMHGNMAGQAVQPFREVHQQVKLLVFGEVPLFHPPGELAQFRFLHQRLTEFPGRKTPQLLGDLTDVVAVHAQGHSGVADCTAGAVPVLHAHQCDALGTETVKDPPVHVVPLGAFDVDVDVRQRGPVPGQEALEDQVVLQGVHLADTDQVVDQAGSPGTAGGCPDPHVLDHPGDLRDSEEVGGESEVPDDPQLVLQPRAHVLVG